MKRKLQCALSFSLAIALFATPMAAQAAPAVQDGAVDDATLAAIQQAAVAVYGVFGGAGVPAEGTPAGTSTVSPSDEPTPEPEAQTGPVTVGELIEYTSDELTIAFPDNWEVSQEGAGFSAEEESTGLSLQIENFGEDVPGLLMVPLFAGQSALFADQLSEGGEITELTRMTIGADALPALRMRFAGVPDSVVGTMDGVIYIIASGRDGYGLYAGAEQTAWQTLGPVVDDIAANLQVHAEYMTLQRAVDEPLTITSEDGAYSLSLPAGWIGSITGEEDLGLIFADPALSIVGAGGASPAAESDDPMLQTLIEGIAGALDGDELQDLVQAVIDNMEMGGNDEVRLDSSLTTVLTSEVEDVLGIIRVAGEAPIMDNASLPFALYVSVYATRAGAFVLFGEPEEILALEPEILDVINSLAFPE